MKVFILSGFVIGTIFNTSISTATSMSECGDQPARPVALNEQSLTSAELKALDQEIAGYFSLIDGYIDCLDSRAESLDWQAGDYEQHAEEIARKQNDAEDSKLMAIESFNRHVSLVEQE